MKTNMAEDGSHPSEQNMDADKVLKQSQLKEQLDKKLKRTIDIIQYREKQNAAKQNNKQLKLLMPPPPAPNKTKGKLKHNKTVDKQVKNSLSQKHKSQKKQFTCTVCNTKTSSLHSLKRHTITKHSSPVKYMCLDCGATSSRKDSYLKHRREFHPPPSIDSGYSIFAMDVKDKSIRVNDWTVPTSKVQSMKDSVQEQYASINASELAVRQNEYGVPYSLTNFEYGSQHVINTQ